MSRLRTQGHRLNTVCELVGISRQAYHKHLQKQNTKEQLYAYLEELVLKNREQKSRVGLRTIYHKENMSLLLGVNQFEQQMSARGYALKPYKSFIKTTDSRGHHYKFDNLISGLEINGENQVVVGDITYYTSGNELYYIFQFQDYYTLEIKGLVGSRNMEGVNAQKCLRQLFVYNKQRWYNHMLILHTDSGGQYRSHKFQAMLKDAQIRPSHAKNCLENGLSERTNGILKNEYLIDYDIKSVSHLNRVLSRVKHQINEVYPSMTLRYRTPKQYAQWSREMEQKDRPGKTVKLVQ